MVKVPEYQGYVQARPAYRQGIDIQATPEAFGAGVGRGLQALGQGMGEAANAMAQVQQLQDSLKAKDALTAFEREKMELDYGQNGYMTKQGSAAVESRAAYNEALEELKKKHGTNLSGRAAATYSNAATSAVTDGMRSGIIHSAQEQKRWFADSSTARLALYQDQALAEFSNPDRVNRSVAAGYMEIDEQAKMLGWSPDVVSLKRKEFASTVHSNVAIALAGQTNGAGNAVKYLKDHSADIDAKTRLDIEQKLKPFVVDEQARSVVDGIITQSRKLQAEPNPTDSGSFGRSGPTSARANLLNRAKAAGKGADHVDGLDKDFATNLSALFEDAPAEIRAGLQVGSGYRSIERQRELWEASDKSGKWVARPGGSQHNHGRAVDIWYNGVRLDKAPANVRDWVHANAANYGLRFPMSWESWHIEPFNARGGGGGTDGAQGSVAVAARDGVSARATMPSYDDAMTQILAIKDPEVRAAAIKQMSQVFEIRSKADAANTEEAKKTIWAEMNRGVKLADIPIETRIAAGREAVSGFMEYENKARQSVTDPVLFRDLTLFAAREPEKFSQVDLTAPEIINRISKSDLDGLINKQGSVLSDMRTAQEKGVQISSAMDFAKNQLEAVGITATGKDGTAREREAQRIAQFQMALTAQMEEFAKANNNRQPTQADIQSMINRLLLPAVVKTPGAWYGENTWTPDYMQGGWFSSPQTRVFDTVNRPDVSNVDVQVKYSDIPIDLRRCISTDLERELGRKPSDEEVVTRYEAFILNLRPIERNP